MVRDTDEANDPDVARTGGDAEVITGSCEHCEWYAVTGSHSEMVTKYQDHLRDEHPTAWVRS